MSGTSVMGSELMHQAKAKVKVQFSSGIEKRKLIKERKRIIETVTFTKGR